MAVPIPDLTLNRALHRDVEEYVIGLIGSGQVQPGDRLNEAEIARRLGISRTPVREAFTRLIKDGVLEHIPRRGVFVPKPSQKSLEEVASLRVVIEGFAAREACQRIRPEEIERLRRIVAEGAEAGRRGEWLAMEEKNAEFHDVLVSSAHHDLLRRVWQILTPMTWKLVPGLRPDPISLPRVEDFVARHQEVIDAIASGDPDRAQRVAESHVKKATAYMLEKSSRERSDPREGREEQ
ncbi:MAG TPA: GntR family transcriptional regulator [Chloroflexota bacterium]|nr:GntR family transcriptional regulator [Chloroflexota bacterium]